jgi:hypothetical protein
MKLTLTNDTEKSTLYTHFIEKDHSRIANIPGNFGDLVLEHISLHGLYGTGTIFTLLNEKDGRFKSHSKEQLLSEFDKVKSIPEVLPYLALIALAKAAIANRNKYNTEDKINSVARLADLAFMLDPQGLDPILDNELFNEKSMAAIVDLMAHGAGYPGLDANYIRQAAKSLEGLSIPHAEEMVMEYYEDELKSLNIQNTPKPAPKAIPKVEAHLKDDIDFNASGLPRVGFKSPVEIPAELKEIYAALRPLKNGIERDYTIGTSLPKNLAERIKAHVHAYGINALVAVFKMLNKDDGFFKNYSKHDLQMVFEDIKTDPQTFRSLALAATSTAISRAKNKHPNGSEESYAMGHLASIIFELEGKSSEDIYSYPGYGSYAMRAMIDLMAYGPNRETVKPDLIKISGQALEAAGVHCGEKLIMEYYDHAVAEQNATRTATKKHQHDEGMQP